MNKFFGLFKRPFDQAKEFYYDHANKKPNKINGLGKIVREICKHFVDQGCFNKAAALSYTTLFSLIPLLAVSFAVFSAFPVFNEVSQKVQQLIFENFVTSSARNIHDYLLAFVNQTAHLSIIGMAILLVTAVLLVFSMESIFNNIWQIARRRHGIAAFLLYWAVITLIPIGISLIAIAATDVLSLPLSEVSAVKGIIQTLLPYCGTFIAFFLLYFSLPNCKVPKSSAAIGALVATVLFEIARYGFAIYVTTFTNYRLVYGALAVLPTFLAWLYITWLVILFGVVISYILTQRAQ